MASDCRLFEPGQGHCGHNLVFLIGELSYSQKVVGDMERKAWKTPRNTTMGSFCSSFLHRRDHLYHQAMKWTSGSKIFMPITLIMGLRLALSNWLYCDVHTTSCSFDCIYLWKQKMSFIDSCYKRFKLSLPMTSKLQHFKLRIWKLAVTLIGPKESYVMCSIFPCILNASDILSCAPSATELSVLIIYFYLWQFMTAPARLTTLKTIRETSFWQLSCVHISKVDEGLGLQLVLVRPSTYAGSFSLTVKAGLFKLSIIACEASFDQFIDFFFFTFSSHVSPWGCM